MSWESKICWELAQQRASVIRSIREFFYSRNIVEVETPLLSHGTVTDVYLDSFSCQYDFASRSSSKDLFLQTSPEFAMKRLLASGYQSIYQICKAFRHESHGRFHNPEFSILEWYRIDFDHFQLVDELADLLSLTLKCGEAERMTYQQVFLKYLKVDPLTCTNALLKETLSDHKVLGDWIDTEQDKDVLLQVLFSECIENQLGSDVPCFIYNYPASQSALAKLSTDDPRVAERFECYYKGVELANGFNELTDPREQISRFETDNAKRHSLGKKDKPLDRLFLAALEHGLPACAGVAVGIDRLLMLALDKPDIASTMTFNITNA
ncbi:elongation factor P--(R)-beta-lysine ligase [Thalassotalea sp. SU-HH00458]|uniref:elongation factor P--(R)-beta-lysine ligase n=1 Tax=Thalassotalea sp. SU-HH00458 TaxID=3127657 RepID=UPI00310A66EE